MNLQENKLPLIIRRRLHELNEIFDDLLKTEYAPHKICIYSNSHELIEHITYSVINEHIYYMYFEHIDDTSEEWESLYRVMENYLVKKYGDKLEKYYERMCENRNTNLDESIKRILIQETGGVDPFIRRRIDLKKFRELFGQGKTYMFYESDTPEEFKWKLVTATLENYLYYKSGLDIDVSDGKYDTVINNLIDLFDGELESIYNDLKKDRGTNLQESKFFRRRIPLDKIENLLRSNAQQTYYETESYDQFKYELTLRAVESIMYYEYNMGWEELPEQEEIDFVTEVSNVLEDKIKPLYNYYNKK